MDGLWLGLAIALGLPLLFLLWVRRPGQTGEPGSTKAQKVDVEALQRAAGLYMGPMPEDERKAFEKASKIVRARVVSAYQTGETINLEVVMDVDLRVLAPEGEYDAQIKEPIEYKDVHRFAEGNEIDVYANPNDHTKVLLCSPAIAAIDREMQEDDRKFKEEMKKFDGD
jgi:hypothetical protein